jgi:cytochrome c peroxidase
MRRMRMFARGVAPALKRRRMCRVVAAVAGAALVAPVAIAQTVPSAPLFPVFPNDQGTLQSLSTNPARTITKNPFFDPSIGTNGQACVTCHGPDVGITITVPFINKAFTATGGTDPLFRFNDTANNPFVTGHTAADYSLILKLGVVRIGKTIPATADFTVVAANAATNANFAAPHTFPLTTDPQHVGTPTLSLFRRPLVNTNVNFDSSVLWDGRENIAALNVQVEHAIQTLLLGAGTDLTGVDQQIANFMTETYTDQQSDKVAGPLNALGALGGTSNLIAISQSPSRPCVFGETPALPATPQDLTPFVLAVASTSSCTPVITGGQPGGVFTMFNSWANLPPMGSVNNARLSIARGQALFNAKACKFCHTVPNLGNNEIAVGTNALPTSPNGFRDIGTDSLVTLNQVKAGFFTGVTPTPAEQQMVQDMIDRVKQLPLYCLRPKTDTSTSACGSDPGDVVTTDPGRALVTGHISDVGMFKPPILRNIAIRSPYYHAGAAPSPQHLINYYNLRFNIGLTAQEQADLVNFVEAL